MHNRGDGTWEVESKWTMGGRENPYVFHHDLFLVPFYYGKRAHVYRLKKNWKLVEFTCPPKHGGPPMAAQVGGSFRYVPTGQNNAIREEITRESESRKILDRFPQIQHIETAYNGICSQYAIAKTLPRYVLSFSELDDLLREEPSQLLAKFFIQVSDPQPGDLAVYSEGAGRRVHMGVYVAPDLIESKWGPVLGVFRHPFFYVDHSYGDTIAFYRPKPD